MREGGMIEGNNNEIFFLWFAREFFLFSQTTVLAKEEVATRCKKVLPSYVHIKLTVQARLSHAFAPFFPVIFFEN